MHFTTWCYKIDRSQEAYSVFRVAIPITQRQAKFILKKRLFCVKKNDFGKLKANSVIFWDSLSYTNTHPYKKPKSNFIIRYSKLF